MLRVMIFFFIFFQMPNSFANQAQVIEALRIKRFFISKAKEITKSLNENKVEYFLSLGLTDELTLANLSVSEIDLVDNRGSLVDAIGIKGHITLSKKRWNQYILQKRELSLLVLHELMRFKGINDDSFGQSLPLLMNITKEKENQEIYCDLNKNTIKYKYKSKNIKAVGVADMGNTHGSIIVNTMDKSEKNNESSKNAMIDAREKCAKSGHNYKVQIISGFTKFGESNYNGIYKRQKETHLKVKCVKRYISKKWSWQIKKDFCNKIEVCQERIKAYSNRSFIQEQLEEVSALAKENKC